MLEVVLGLGPQRAGRQSTETVKKQMPGKQVSAWSVEAKRHWEELEPADFAGFLLPTHLVHVICSYLWWQLPSWNRTFICVLWDSGVRVCVCSVTHSCLTLCSPMVCSPPGSSVHGILQARILEWVAMPFSRGSSWPRGQAHTSCIGTQVSYH